MEKISNQQNHRLQDFLEGKLSGAEATVLKAELEKSAVLRRQLEELRLLHSLLTERSKMDTIPSSDFTYNVMRNLDRNPSTVSTLSPRNGLLLLVGILVATGTGMFLLATGSLDSMNGLLPLKELNLPKVLTDVSIKTIPLSLKIIMKIAIIISLAIAFVVLDRTVLKPFFDRKHRRQSFS